MNREVSKMLLFYDHSCAHSRQMGQANSEGNEAKLFTKHPSDCNGVDTHVLEVCGEPRYYSSH
jgi:hypothetical protein